MDKIINSRCICGKHLSKYRDNLIVILPCQHLIHKVCTNYLADLKCPYCHKHIKNILTDSEVLDIVKKSNHPMYYQMYVDMAAVGNMADTGSINWFILLCRFPGLFDNFFETYMARNTNDVNFMISELLDICNFKIIIKNKHKILKGRKAIISNHVNSIDPLPIYHIFKCGFVSSAMIKDNWYGNKLSKLVPIVIIERNKSTDTTEKIKSYIRKNGDICIFPEGMTTHPKTIARFRTGAFYLGVPVQPIVISYKPNIYDWDFKSFMMKLYSQKKITITVKVLDPIYPPFNYNIIENIRQRMGKVGDMALSRVSNRDIVDK